MTLQQRAFVVVGLGLVFVVPVVTLHAALRLTTAGDLPTSSLDPGFLALVALSALALWPCLGALAALSHWRKTAQLFAPVARQASPVTHFGVSYRRINSPGIVLFTAGWRRPAIYVTSGAESAMSPEMFRAALLHEEAHLRAHDSRWRPLLSALGQSFRPIQALRAYTAGLVAASEFAADDEAIRLGAERSALFDAVVLSCPMGSSHPALAGGNLAERLAHLADPAQPSTSNPSRSGPAALLTWAVGAPLLAHGLLAAGFLCHAHFVA